VISDALQVGLLGWSRLNRRHMCSPCYWSSIVPLEGQIPSPGGYGAEAGNLWDLLSRSPT
jgi:hypothetical protein